MKIQGNRIFNLPRDVVWKGLLDPDIISRALPGCEELNQVGENEYTCALAIELGPVQGQFEGKFRLSHLKPPESYHLKLSGKGSSGFLEGDGDIWLEDQEGSTRLDYTIEARIGGRIAGIGQRLLDSSASLVVRQGLEQLQRQIEVHYQNEGAEDSTRREVQSPSQAQFAVKIAKGVLLEELRSKGRLPLALGAGLVVLALLLIVFPRACS